MKKILVGIADAQLFMLLRHIIAKEGFDAVQVSDSDDLMGHEAGDVVAIAIDWSLRVFEKHDLLQAAKALMPDAAVILLCRNIDPSTIELPECDLLLQRPFEPAQLLNFLRRLREENPVVDTAEHPQPVLRFADLEMNTAAVTVHRGGRAVNLTALEFRLLRQLLQKPTTVVDREQLINSCWPQDVEVEPRTVDIHIAHIRRALGVHGSDLIRTVRGCGYALVLP